jgi:hypothetical protein
MNKISTFSVFAVLGLVGCSGQDGGSASCGTSSEVKAGAPSMTEFARQTFGTSVWVNSQATTPNYPTEAGQGHIQRLISLQDEFLLQIYTGGMDESGWNAKTRVVTAKIQSITSAGGPHGEGNCDNVDPNTKPVLPVLGEIALTVVNDDAHDHTDPYPYAYAYTFYCDTGLLSVTPQDGSGISYQPDTLIKQP